MKKIETLVYGFVILVSLVVFGFTFTSKVNAAEACDNGDRYCSSSGKRCLCSSNRWSCITCSYGCSGGYCKSAPPPPPTCTYTCTTWGACNSMSWQVCTAESKTPSGCTGGSSKIGTTRGCTYTPPPPPTCTYTCTTWGACNSMSWQVCTAESKTPSGCTGGSSKIGTTRGCTYTPPTCTWTCTDWTACNSSGVKYCNSQTKSPSDCTGGTSVTSASCTPSDPTFYYYSGGCKVAGTYRSMTACSVDLGGATCYSSFDACESAHPCTEGDKRCVWSSCVGSGGGVEYCTGGNWNGLACCASAMGYSCSAGSCVSTTSTCEGMWSVSTCIATASCPEELQFGVVPGCSFGNVCCGRPDTIMCDDSGFLNCGECQKCINPGTVLSKCQSTRTAGGDGVCGGASGGKYATAPTSGLCSSSYGNSSVSESGGVYHWTCNGQTTSGTCVSDGDDSGTCSATKCTNQPVVNGACNSNITGTSANDLCYNGTTPVYVTGDANHDYIDDSDPTKYIWGCQGSRHVCSEEDGTDRLDCSSAMNQRPWYQVNNGSILAKGKVENYVPTTCNGNGNNCNPSTVSNGGVYSRVASSMSSSDQSQKTSSNAFNFKTYTYNQLKSQYFDSKGVGTVLTGDNATWAKVKDNSGVIFVDGDLKVTDNLNTSNFVMIVAKGTITIDPSVTLINGILVADKVVAAADIDTTSSVAKLVVNGMIHGVTEVEFSRSLLPNSLNNDSPSVEVNYKPEYLFMIPNALSKAFNKWKIN